jgi:hypothetical protein
MRKTILAIASAVALATATMGTGALARGWAGAAEGGSAAGRASPVPGSVERGSAAGRASLARGSVQRGSPGRVSLQDRALFDAGLSADRALLWDVGLSADPALTGSPSVGASSARVSASMPLPDGRGGAAVGSAVAGGVNGYRDGGGVGSTSALGRITET